MLKIIAVNAMKVIVILVMIFVLVSMYLDYLDLPVVYMSVSTGECVKVENSPTAKQKFDCVSVMPERYIVETVR